MRGVFKSASTLPFRLNKATFTEEKGTLLRGGLFPT